MKNNIISALGLIGLGVVSGCGGGSNNAVTTVPTAHLAITLPAGPAYSGTPYSFTVSALDATNALVPTYVGTVQITTSDKSAQLSANATLARGKGTFTVTFGAVGSYTITASDTVGNATAGTSAAVSVSPNTVGGTVSGLVGSGLTLGICPPTSSRGGHPKPCNSVLHVVANGAFTLPTDYPAGFSGSGSVTITQQPSSPTQRCVIGNAAFNIQTANDTSVTVYCGAEYAYVTNAADNTLSSYSVDATSGALAVIGTPTATGASPRAIGGLEYSVAEYRRYLYIGNEGSNDVSAFAVNPTTGTLTAVPGSPFAAGTDPQAMVLYGPYLYVANAGSDNVFYYAIDVNTGALAEHDRIATGKGPTSIAADGFDGFIFVANHGGSNDISAFHFSDLTPVPGSPFPAGGNPLSLAVGGLISGNARQFLYTANPDVTHPSISGFSIDPTSGTLSPLSGSPFPLPVSHYIATDQTGAYLYVTSDANIVGYAIDAMTGALTALPGFPVAAGANAYSITIDPTNQFLYVANDGAANIAGFSLNVSTGALTPMSGAPFPTGNHPQFMTF